VKEGKAGIKYSLNLRATGGKTPYFWSYSGDFPDWAYLDTSTGAIATWNGAKPVEGTYLFSVKVKDSLGGWDTQEITLVIDP
jgi:hypothetical protein